MFGYMHFIILLLYVSKFALYIVRPFQFLLFFCLLPVFIVLGAEGDAGN
jgi:hypothetical protein